MGERGDVKERWRIQTIIEKVGCGLGKERPRSVTTSVPGLLRLLDYSIRKKSVAGEVMCLAFLCVSLVTIVRVMEEKSRGGRGRWDYIRKVIE
jgi:hypothetical protein